MRPSVSRVHQLELRSKYIRQAHGIHKYPSLWIFKTGWDIVEVLIPFMLQETLEDYLQIWFPQPCKNRAIAYGVSTFVSLCVYFALSYWSYVLRHSHELQSRMKLLPNKGKGMSGMHIIKKHQHEGEAPEELAKETEEHTDLSLFEEDRGASMSVHPDQGILLPPRYPVGTVVLIRLTKLFAFFTTLALKDFVQDLIEIRYPGPSTMRAFTWAGLSVIGFVLVIASIFAIPAVQQNLCGKKSSHTTPAPLSGKGRLRFKDPKTTSLGMRPRTTTINKARQKQDNESRTRERLASLTQKRGHLSHFQVEEAVTQL